MECSYCDTEQPNLILHFDRQSYICEDYKSCMERMPKKDYSIARRGHKAYKFICIYEGCRALVEVAKTFCEYHNFATKTKKIAVKIKEEYAEHGTYPRWRLGCRCPSCKQCARRVHYHLKAALGTLTKDNRQEAINALGEHTFLTNIIDINTYMNDDADVKQMMHLFNAAKEANIFYMNDKEIQLQFVQKSTEKDTRDSSRAPEGQPEPSPANPEAWEEPGWAG